MKNLTNSELAEIFEANDWNFEETKSGRIIAESFEYESEIYNSALVSVNLDVTGWTAEQIEDKFGFDESSIGNSESAYFRNHSAYGSDY